MRYCWTHSSFLCLLFILSCWDSGICLDTQQIQVMKSLFNLSFSWKNANSDDPCVWGGVNCTADGNSVIELHVSSFGLTGNAWQIVCQLQALDVSNNSLSTPSDNDIKACISLVALNISSNSMSGSLPSLAPMHKLQFLDISHNELRGYLGSQIQNLTNLRVLNLSFNNFTGPIHPLLSSRDMLETLDLSQNSFAGEFPQELVKCTSLTFLDLSFNGLNGKIPDSIRNLIYLSTLIMSSNHLSGMIPETLGLLSNLTHFASNKNQLTGSIPVQLANLTGLQFLDLSYNLLNGSIPPEIFALSNLQTLDLTNNSLTRQIPQKFSEKLFRLRIGHNSLSGSIPLTIGSALGLTYLEMNGNLLDGQIPQQLGHCTNLQLLDPSNVFLNNKFGTYYKAVMPSGISYSVKKLNWTDKSFNSANYRELGPELEKQGKLSHPNILTHLAHVLDKDCGYLFYEYVQKGCLSEFLHTTSVSVDWPSRCSIAIGVAHGLAFLHGCERPILHLDLTAKNILLKSLTEPQIGDTELFKIIDPSKSTGIFSVIAGSVGYVPPEYAYTMRVTAAGNVYSFGVILLELLTGRPPITNGMDLAKRVQSILLEEETWNKFLRKHGNKFLTQESETFPSKYRMRCFRC